MSDMDKYRKEQASPRELVCRYVLEEFSAHCVTRTRHKGNTALIEACTEDRHSLTGKVLISEQKHICS